MLTELLSSVGFEIKQAFNGLEALNLWESWSPHLIWMDMQMPIMNGYDATKAIRQHPMGEDTVIIALTASVFDEQRELILAAGCDDFVGKPFQEAIILNKLSQYLGVKYIYERSSQKNLLTPQVTQETLSIMPKDWLQQIYQAAYCLDAELIQQLIEEIPPSKATLAKGLEELLNNFNTDIIMELTQPLISN